MKSIFAILALVATFTASAKAADCMSADGVPLMDGASAAFYYVSSPREQLGPNYSCSETFRTRTCMNGTLSNFPTDCRSYDSGTCDDSWIDRLADSEFNLALCQD